MRHRRSIFLVPGIFVPILVIILQTHITFAAYEYYYPVKNQNFTADASGWVYGEENDANGMASGAWSSTGGNNDPGSYKFSVEDASITAMANVEQYINYSFTVNNVDDLQAARIYASFDLTCDNNFVAYAYINLIRPGGDVQRIWTSQTYTDTATFDSGWINVSIDALSNFTQTGTYQISLAIHTETSDSGVDVHRTNCYHYLDDAGIELVYPLSPPKWYNQFQKYVYPAVGAPLEMGAYWEENVGLDSAWLSTNESGSWKNYTGGTYYPYTGFGNTVSGWSNFTWLNLSVPPNQQFCWKIYANDTSDNLNGTNTICVSINSTNISMEISGPELTYNSIYNPLLLPYNSSIDFNISLHCISEGDDGSCARITTALFYNKTSGVPDTPVSISPFEWKYRREIRISNPDHQVPITLNTNNFDYSKARENGEDLRFTLYNFTSKKEEEINYWIEKWNTSGESRIWIKLPKLEHVNYAVVYMYYGNNYSTNKSSEKQTMSIVNGDFDDPNGKGWRCFEDEFLNKSQDPSSLGSSCTATYSSDYVSAPYSGYVYTGSDTGYCGAYGLIQEVEIPDVDPIYLHLWIKGWADSWAGNMGVTIENGTYNQVYWLPDAGGTSYTRPWTEAWVDVSAWSGQKVRLKVVVYDSDSTYCNDYTDHDEYVIVDDFYFSYYDHTVSPEIVIGEEESGAYYPEGTFPYKFVIHVNSTQISRENWPIIRDVNFTEYFLNANMNGAELDRNSIRVFEIDDNGNPLHELKAIFTPIVSGYDSKNNAAGKLIFIINGTTQPDQERRFAVYFDTYDSSHVPRIKYFSAEEVLEENELLNSFIQEAYWYTTQQRTTYVYGSLGSYGAVVNPENGDIVPWGMCTGVILWDMLYNLTGDVMLKERINLSLDWLKRKQEANGAWKLQYYLDGSVEYDYELPGANMFCPRAIAYYQGISGDTSYQDVMQKGIDFLASLQNQTNGGVENHYYGADFKYTFENGEAIRAFADVGKVLNNDTYRTFYAENSFNFIFQGWNSAENRYYEYEDGGAWGSDDTRYPMPAQALTNWMGVLYLHPDNTTALERAKLAMQWADANTKWSAEPAYDKDTAVDYVYPHYTPEAIGTYLMLYNITGNVTFFNLANESIYWLLGMQKSNGAFYDSKDTSTSDLDDTEYTFHQSFPGFAIMDYFKYASPLISVSKTVESSISHVICDLSKDESCSATLELFSNEPVGSFWKGKVSSASDIPVIEKNETTFLFKIVLATNTFRLSIVNSSDVATDSTIRFYDASGNFMEERVGQISKVLEYHNNYTIEIVNGSLHVKIHHINISSDINTKAQIVDTYLSTLPSTITSITPVFAFNDTGLTYSHATLYIPKEGINVNKILHCLDWDFTTAECSQWEVNDTSDYNAQENTTHIWFNVTHFYAYAGGEAAGANSQLEIWDDTDTETKYTGEQIYFYANYSNATSSEPIYGTGVTCNISFNISGTWTAWEEMTYNSTSLLYEYNRSFSTAGTFLWNVSCDGSALGYDPLNASDNVTVTSSAVGTLLVSLISPSSDIYVAQNTTFIINASVNCTGGSCGNVQATARYNSSSLYPDTAISTTQGATPFYVVDGINPKSCSNNPLGDGDSCYIWWEVNTTGTIGSAYKIGALFESDLSGVNSNHTTNITVTIVSCVVSLTLGWNSINFSTLPPGSTDNPAVGNSDYLYNVTVDLDTTCNVDLYIKGSDLNKTGSSYYIGVGNVSWDTENNPSTSTPMTETYNLLYSAAAPGTNVTTFYWIDVPSGIAADTYSGYVWIKGVESE